jgi:antitoxin component of MazEF toxin-antitoxin module
MRLTLRRIGNSIGVIIPRATLAYWGVGEGDYLEVAGRAIRPPSATDNVHEVLDELKRRLAVAVAARHTAHHIRAHSLANLHRWKCNGVWASVYDEWRQLLLSGDDGALFAALLGRDEHGNRLRQSPPYVGMLARDEVVRLNEEAMSVLESFAKAPVSKRIRERLAADIERDFSAT